MNPSFWNPNLLLFVLTPATEQLTFLFCEAIFHLQLDFINSDRQGIRSFRIIEYFRDLLLNTSKPLDQGSVTKIKDSSTECCFSILHSPCPHLKASLGQKVPRLAKASVASLPQPLSPVILDAMLSASIPFNINAHSSIRTKFSQSQVPRIHL